MHILKIDAYSLLFLVFIVVVFPVAITAFCEFFLLKPSVFRMSLSLLLFTSLIAAALYFSIIRSDVTLGGDTLHINHIIYSRTLKPQEIRSLNFYDQLPEHLKPTLRTNGIGIGRVRIGNFKTKNSAKGFYLYASSPVSVITTEKETLVFSSSAALHRQIVAWHDKSS